LSWLHYITILTENRRLSDRYRIGTDTGRIASNRRLRNDLYCVGWGVKLYSLTHRIDSYRLLLYRPILCASLQV